MPPLVRMIAQAHLDPVWLWRWTEGRAEALATSQSAVDRLHEYPALHYTRGEAQVYEWIEQENPTLFAQIKALIEAGRWHVVNGMIVQPDMNLPQGESFVRQALLAKRYFRQKLGVDVRTAYCVDSFGHAGTLPQVLKKCGLDYYVFMRPQAHEKELPAQAFRWQAPDGSQVLAFRISGAYSTRAPNPTDHVQLALDDASPKLGDTMCFFGVGNHGGGPTRAQIEKVLELAQARRDVEIRFDHPEAYFQAIAPRAGDLPVVAGELQYHATGCYSANSALKRAHRRAECALLLAERVACLAELWAGHPAKREQLRALWHDVAFNQFHDTLAGSSLKEAEDEAIAAFGRVVLGARELADTGGRLIGARVDTSGPGSTVLLFNPFPYRRQEYVEYEPWTDWERWERAGWVLLDDEGRRVPHQVLEAQAAIGNEERGIDRLVFKADLPPLGYRLYRFARRGEVTPGCRGEDDPPGYARAHPAGLENDRLAISLDPESGAIVSCQDEASGIELAGPGGWNVAQVLEDTSDTWSHGVRAFDTVLGCFGQPRISLGDEGPLQASLYLERGWEGSTWLQQLVVRAGEPEILVRNWLHWQGRWRMVKLAFDVAVSEPGGWRDVPFGALPCPADGGEIPLQMWMDVSGEVSPHPTLSRGERASAVAEGPGSQGFPLAQGEGPGVSGEVSPYPTLSRGERASAVAKGPGSQGFPLAQGEGSGVSGEVSPHPTLSRGERASAVEEGPGDRASPLPWGEGPGVRAGLAVLNDGKYAGDVNGSTLRLTILRSPPYAYHVPHVIGSKRRYDWVDQGPQEFTLVLRPHLRDWRQAGVVRRARELNLPILPVTMHTHPGELPATGSLAHVDSDELELTALKPAEDGQGYVLRIADRHGYGGAGTLTWLGQSFAVACKSFEILTLRLERRDGRWRALPCDMIERVSDT